jgi:hypothetical protein
MGLIARLEDLECWKEARILARRVYNLPKRDVFDQDQSFAGSSGQQPLPQ